MKARRKKAEVNGRHGDEGKIIRKRVSALKPSPENELLYRERTADDSDFARLVDSIRKDGVKAPLLVSLDGFIISGHQRQKGAIAVGLRTVPVIVLNLRREDHTADQWLAILREHNTGREKTFDELVREKLVDIDPSEAISQIVDDEVERTRARVKLIDIGEKEMKRSRISHDKRGMADAILEVLRDLCEYLPISLKPSATAAAEAPKQLAEGHDAAGPAEVAKLPPEGRDAGGKFTVGNRCGKGNPHARRMAALRQAFLSAATDARMEELGETLYAAAVRGDWQAAKLFLLFVLGRPQGAVDPDTLDRDEWKQFQEWPQGTAIFAEFGKVFFGDALRMMRKVEEMSTPKLLVDADAAECVPTFLGLGDADAAD